MTEEYQAIETPQTKLGELYQLGSHYLLCGDATKIEDINVLMQGKQADLVVTDPPYNVEVESENKELKESGKVSLLNDNLSDEEFHSFLLATFSSYHHLMKETAAIYIFHGSSYQREFENAMNTNNIIVRSQCIWVNNNVTFGWSQYRWQHEPFFMRISINKHLVGMEIENSQRFGEMI